MPLPGPYPRFPSTVPGIVRLALARGQRSFRRDVQSLVGQIEPPLCVLGRLPDVSRGSWLVVVNHYFRPGFRAWWIPMAIARAVPREIGWVMTSTLTFPDRLRAATVTPASHWFLRHVSGLYGFVAMPPMPPRPFEVEERAHAVRRALRLAELPDVIMGLAPEGGDMPEGVLSPPPPGAGRFMWHLAQRGLRLVPMGAYEEQGKFCLRIGAPFELPRRADNGSEQNEIETSSTVMRAIAACLPPPLRGVYG